MEGKLYSKVWLLMWGGLLGLVAAAPEAELAILSDAAHTRDNLLKLAKEYGRDGKSEMRGRDFAITIR